MMSGTVYRRFHLIVCDMSMQFSRISVIATVIVGLLVIGSVYYFVSQSSAQESSQISALSQQNANLNGQVANLGQQLGNSNNQQIASLNQQITNLDGQIGSLNQQVGAGNQRISSLQQQVSTLEQNTATVITVSNTVETVVTTTSVTTTTVTSVTQVPQSTLVVVQDSYSNTTKTFTFQVQNTQSYTVYAQLSASLWGQSSFGCNGQIGTFISQVYAFNPGTVTSTTLDLHLGQYVGFCGGNPVTSLQMNFVIPQSTAVSPTYSFNIVPGYSHA
jgi:archaellum component FlaC